MLLYFVGVRSPLGQTDSLVSFSNEHWGGGGGGGGGHDKILFWGGGGWVLNKFLYWEALPRGSNPYPFISHLS